jgi:hypothetical protein
MAGADRRRPSDMSEPQLPQPQLWPPGTDWCGLAAPTVWGPAYGAIPKNPPGVRAP